MNQFLPQNITEFIKSTDVLLLSRQKGCDFLKNVIRDLELFKTKIIGACFTRKY